MEHESLCNDWVFGDFPGQQTCVCKLIRRVRAEAIAAIEKLGKDDDDQR
jgi:hypothetical protein